MFPLRISSCKFILQQHAFKISVLRFLYFCRHET
jgi:hypothetical protein